jgi:nucleoside-diphosphate-sugar epimerase
MKILVTGATGFVGCFLCLAAEKLNWSVVAAIRSSTDPSILPDTVDRLRVDSLAEDISHEDLVGVDAVIYLAARVHVMNDADENPIEAYRAINTSAPLILAEKAAQAGVHRFIYLSSIKVNGEGSLDSHTIYTEEDKPFAKLDPYGQSKWEAEIGLRKIASSTPLEVVILRPPLVYGPGVKANFCQLLNLVQSYPIIPLGNINNVRSLIYVENLVDSIIACVTHPNAGNQTFLVSDSQDISTSELIVKIRAALDSNAILVPLPVSTMLWLGQLTGKSAVLQRLLGSLVVDSKKIKETLNWSPPFTLEQGLAKTSAWFKSQ